MKILKKTLMTLWFFILCSLIIGCIYWGYLDDLYASKQITLYGEMQSEILATEELFFLRLGENDLLVDLAKELRLMGCLTYDQMLCFIFLWILNIFLFLSLLVLQRQKINKHIISMTYFFTSNSNKIILNNLKTGVNICNQQFKSKKNYMNKKVIIIIWFFMLIPLILGSLYFTCQKERYADHHEKKYKHIHSVVLTSEKFAIMQLGEKYLLSDLTKELMRIGHLTHNQIIYLLFLWITSLFLLLSLIFFKKNNNSGSPKIRDRAFLGEDHTL